MGSLKRALSEGGKRSKMSAMPLKSKLRPLDGRKMLYAHFQKATLGLRAQCSDSPVLSYQSHILDISSKNFQFLHFVLHPHKSC